MAAADKPPKDAPLSAVRPKVRAEIKRLVKGGAQILLDENAAQKGDKKKDGSAVLRYQDWYTAALPVVRQLMPDRYSDFQAQYKLDRRKDITLETYTISDYLIGLVITRLGQPVFQPFDAFVPKFQQQIQILRSGLARLDSALSDIRGLVQAELFDDQFSTARELKRAGHLRAAGAVAGVALESHLKEVSVVRGAELKKKDPTLSDYNDALKAAGIFDVPNWRAIQRLTDIRNLCVHSRDRDPTTAEVEELINGAEKVTKTLF
jgi:hypothetical protein